MADIKPLDDQAISEDDELANVLAGVKNEAASAEATAPAAEPELAEPSIAVVPPVPPVPSLDFEETPVEAPLPTPVPAPAQATSPVLTTPVAANPELESLKKDVLSELRPLAGHLELPPEEKFDTLLLIIRSTDDQTLLAPAHEAAKSIADESRRAAALLDVIKEIDYFSTKA